ncbi:MAG: PKD domain-containing protein, partial [Bacteroidota bacterium]
DINFGNTGQHTSKISVPGWFVCTGTGPDAFYTNPYLFKYTAISAEARYLDYNTTYNGQPRVVFMDPIGSNNGSFTPDPPGGYPSGYTSWGDSSFNLKIRKYNTYIKQAGKGAYFLDIWQYNNGTGYKNYYSGDTFAVPDNTTITATQLQMIYVYHPEDVFEFDKPDEGALIPYTSSYVVEAHMEGMNESSANAWLISPVTKKFSYNTTVGEYLVANIDTRPFEGQTKLFKGQMNLTNNTKMYTMVNASIDWELNTVTTPTVTSDVTYSIPARQVKGNVTVTASIGGKWQLNTSAIIVVNNNQLVNMTVITPGNPSTVRGQFDAEPYAGRTIPVYIRVLHAKGLPYTAESPHINMTVLSKVPIHANFTANPWSGRAPHEVAFTDLSTGGAYSWTWNFKDGNTSSEQNPIHIFRNEGNSSVRLTVVNASNQTDFIEKNITVNGKWYNVNLLTSRTTSLADGGTMSWISRGANSYINISGITYPLNSGDSVEVRLNGTQNSGKIFMAGGITECNLSRVNCTINGLVYQGNVSGIRVQDLENFHSNLTLTSLKSYYAWITFQWDNLPIPVSWKRDLQITDLMPTSEKFMSLEISPSQAFFDGTASQYSFI